MLGGWQSRPVDATITASTVHNAGIADIASIAVLYDSGIQGCFLPSFGHDLETECTLASSSLVPSRRCKPTLWEPKSETTRAAEFTVRIKKTNNSRDHGGLLSYRSVHGRQCHDTQLGSCLPLSS
jgi:hypothetical protein